MSLVFCSYNSKLLCSFIHHTYAQITILNSMVETNHEIVVQFIMLNASTLKTII